MHLIVHLIVHLTNQMFVGHIQMQMFQVRIQMQMHLQFHGKHLNVHSNTFVFAKKPGMYHNGRF